MVKEEVKSQEKMIEEEQLYADPTEKHVDASGALAWSERKEQNILSLRVPSGVASTASKNIHITHKSNTINIAKVNNVKQDTRMHCRIRALILARSLRSSKLPIKLNTSLITETQTRKAS